MIKFYDTTALIKQYAIYQDDIFDENFVISSETIKYLEQYRNINIHAVLLDALRIYENKYIIWIYNNTMCNIESLMKQDIQSLSIKDIACALDYDNNMNPDNTLFITSSLYAKQIANLVFGEDSIQLI